MITHLPVLADALRLTHIHLLTKGHAQIDGLSTFSHKPATQFLLFFFLLNCLSSYLVIFPLVRKIVENKQRSPKIHPYFSSWLTTHLNKEWWLELKRNIQNNQRDPLKNSLLNWKYKKIFWFKNNFIKTVAILLTFKMQQYNFQSMHSSRSKDAGIYNFSVKHQ